MKTTLLAALAVSIGAAVAAPPVPAPSGAIAPVPEWLDTNGDGVISELERQAFVESRRGAGNGPASRWDTNGDGTIDDDERAAAVEALKAKATRKLTELFLAVAGDDGVLTPTEFSALPVLAQVPADTVALLFGLLDVDGDGEVTVDEFLDVVGGDVKLPSHH